MVSILEGDCVEIMQDMEADQFHALICDMPFGIAFDGKTANYNRDAKLVIGGYVDVPKNSYYDFCMSWMQEAKRVLRDEGCMWVLSSWNNIDIAMRALKETGFEIVNDISWKYSFGVYTKRRFVNSHYHILYCCKKGCDNLRYFDRESRFADDEMDDNKGKLQYKDREDVWVIPKTYIKGREKVATKLPNDLVLKMLQYTVKSGDLVLDPFAGSGTTGSVCEVLGCKSIMIDINPKCVEYMKREFEK